MTLDQRFDASTLGVLRETVAACAAAAGMADERAAEVTLALHELAANAVRHGGGTGRLRMQVTSGELACEVSDPGPGAQNGLVPGAQQRSPAGMPAQPWPYQPGHGLWLVRQVADDLSVVTGPAGSTVTVVFFLVSSSVIEGPAAPEPPR